METPEWIHSILTVMELLLDQNLQEKIVIIETMLSLTVLRAYISVMYITETLQKLEAMHGDQVPLVEKKMVDEVVDEDEEVEVVEMEL